jgi:hypothetical protein
MKPIVVFGAAALLTLGNLCGSAQATVFFADNFNSYPTMLNWVPPANWSAPGPGTVDLIGNTTSGPFFDFFPGNGGYVDLDGSNGIPGTLQTLQSFAAGSYTLTFDLAGNARGDVSKTTVITLGNFTQSITLASSDPYQLRSFTFTTTGGPLVFGDLAGGNGDIGNILDNVQLSSAVPEPSTWAMMLLGFAGLGFLAHRRRREAEMA